MKGVTNIKLFDAKTGELLQEVEKTNLVTNAFRNIIVGLNKFSHVNGGQSNTLRNAFTANKAAVQDLTTEEMLKALFGGLMVFSAPIANDADHIIPTKLERKTYIGGGHQGSSVAGSPCLGTLSAASEYVAGDHIKFQWDFTASQCNGAIASICLTSDQGGYTGFRADDTVYSDRAQRFYRYPSTYAKGSGSIGNQDKAYKMYGNSNASGYSRSSDYKKHAWFRGHAYKIWDLSGAWRQKFKAFESVFNPTTPSEQTAGGSEQWFNNNAGIRTLDYGKIYSTMNGQSEGRYWYEGWLELGWIEDIFGSSPTLQTQNKQYRALFDDIVSSMDISSWSTRYKSTLMGNSNFLIKDGYAYFLPYVYDTSANKAVMKMYKLKLSDGTYTSNVIPFSDAMKAYWFNNTSKNPAENPEGYLHYSFDTLYMHFNVKYQNKYWLFEIDLDNLTVSEYPVMSDSGWNFISAGAGASRPNEVISIPELAPAPFCFMFNGLSATSDEYGLGLNVFMPYLATINNQETALVKDNTKTMQITYTLYPEAE